MKSCPNCESHDVTITVGIGPTHADDFVFCITCAMSGPSDDPAGAKWDALPRREDIDRVANIYEFLWKRETTVAMEAESIAAYLAGELRKIDRRDCPSGYRRFPDVAWVRPRKMLRGDCGCSIGLCTHEGIHDERTTCKDHRCKPWVRGE